MIFEQYELSCLSQFSYLIGDETTGRAVVVDPQRDVGMYLTDAERRGLTIERVIETHFHADFLSGHLELAAATGAAISFGRVSRRAAISAIRLSSRSKATAPIARARPIWRPSTRAVRIIARTLIAGPE